MVTWDESWSFTVKYSVPKYAKADIMSVSIAEADGKTTPVYNGGQVTISKPPISIAVVVKNIGDGAGTIYVECLVDGASKGTKSVTLSPGQQSSAGSLVWSGISLAEGSHTIVVRARH
ncbi:MAG: hypothetical protein J7J61_06850 [Candidatus Hydrothermae bacterium]|nr:hypothetical protein [Candidatus Hydrothermae bacterium]